MVFRFFNKFFRKPLKNDLICDMGTKKPPAIEAVTLLCRRLYVVKLSVLSVHYLSIIVVKTYDKQGFVMY